LFCLRRVEKNGKPPHYADDSCTAAFAAAGSAAAFAAATTCAEQVPVFRAAVTTNAETDAAEAVAAADTADASFLPPHPKQLRLLWRAACAAWMWEKEGSKLEAAAAKLQPLAEAEAEAAEQQSSRAAAQATAAATAAAGHCGMHGDFKCSSRPCPVRFRTQR